MAKWPKNMSAATMLNYDAIAAAWTRLVDVSGPGPGPWEPRHDDRTRGWCCVQPRVTGTRPIWVQTRREAVAVCAALNAVLRRKEGT